MVSWVETACDNGKAHPEPERERPKAITRTYRLGDVQGLCDLCARCGEGISVRDLKAILLEQARPIDEAEVVRKAVMTHVAPIAQPSEQRSTRFPIACLDVTCPQRFAQSQRSSMRNHYQKVHGLSTGVPPLPKTMRQCPICPATSKGPTGVGYHVARNHPEIGGALLGAITLAAEGDDQFGVAAEVVAWLRKNGATIEF